MGTRRRHECLRSRRTQKRQGDTPVRESSGGNVSPDVMVVNDFSELLTLHVAHQPVRRVVDQILPAQPFTYHLVEDNSYLLKRVMAAQIQSSADLLHIPPHVFGADVVVGADDHTPDQSPNALNAVGRRIAVYVLAAVVVDHDVSVKRWHVSVGRKFIRVDDGPGFNVAQDEAVQRVSVFAGDRFNHHSAFALDRSNHRGFAGGASSTVSFLAGVFVLFPSTQVHFVDLNHVMERNVVVAPCFTDAVNQKPSCLVREQQVFYQNRSRRTLRSGYDQIDGYCPRVQRQVTALHASADLDAEVFATRGAPIRHWLVVTDSPDTL